MYLNWTTEKNFESFLQNPYSLFFLSFIYLFIFIIFFTRFVSNKIEADTPEDKKYKQLITSKIFFYSFFFLSFFHFMIRVSSGEYFPCSQTC